MSTLTFYETFHHSITDSLATSYPETERQFSFRSRIVQTLISPYVLTLPMAIHTQAQSIVGAFFRLRNLPEWQAHVAGQAPAVTDPGNTSILMSYDFHIDENQNLRLIEINTNASLSLIVDELYRFQKVENVFSPDFRTEILRAFEQEYSEANGRVVKAKDLKIGIVDHKPREQRLFIEFAMYQELFGKLGWTTDFFDPSELSFTGDALTAAGTPLDLIYNRETDFYFTDPSTKALRDAMMAKVSALTPHPHEYRLLADKDRLLELSNEEFFNSLPVSNEDRTVMKRALIKTAEVKNLEPEQLWKDRKKWFFKPRRSHGGKAVYRGSSTSRGTFQSILAGDYLAQELVAPPTVRFEAEADELKYDLRFYVYRDKIQLACARLYRGQMTNSQSLGGGVAPIKWQPEGSRERP